MWWSSKYGGIIVFEQLSVDLAFFDRTGVGSLLDEDIAKRKNHTNHICAVGLLSSPLVSFFPLESP